LNGKKHCLWLFVGVVAAVLPLDMGVRADGDDFFLPQEIPGKPEYVVFGNVKDDRGNYVSTAVVTVEVEEPVLIFETTTTLLGRFRTVDIGRAVSELGYELDPGLVKVSVSAPGYVLIRRLNRSSPRQKHGAVEIDFLMTKEK
jgi:hypothetical protein